MFPYEETRKTIRASGGHRHTFRLLRWFLIGEATLLVVKGVATLIEWVAPTLRVDFPKHQSHVLQNVTSWMVVLGFVVLGVVGLARILVLAALERWRAFRLEERESRQRWQARRREGEQANTAEGAGESHGDDGNNGNSN